MDEFNNINGVNDGDTSSISSSDAMNAVEGASGMTSGEALNAVEDNAVQSGNVTTEEGAAEPAAEGSGFAPYGDQSSYNTNNFGPYTPPESGTGENKTLAIVSLVCGIAGLVFSIICGCCSFAWLGAIIGAAGVVTGIINKKKNLPGNGLALGGIITGGISVLIGVGQIILVILSAILSAASSAM